MATLAKRTIQYFVAYTELRCSLIYQIALGFQAKFLLESDGHLEHTTLFGGGLMPRLSIN